ncbi:unnamed protein product [Gongylonema pulchrum]|uniref:Uncharacterized protein n=1 Tax=Gongylonema pulchrum TaxID=637853 RepID=A0A3P7RQN4_9BILA|nr:unnamed protein product [Gongylonema pulchrum]
MSIEQQQQQQQSLNQQKTREQEKMKTNEERVVELVQNDQEVVHERIRFVCFFLSFGLLSNKCLLLAVVLYIL